MKKSIYYLVANILSTIAAAIFMGVVNHQLPFFSLGDFVVVGMSQNCWEPMKFVLPVVALSIIHVTRDVVVHKDNNQNTTLDKVINIVMCVVTVISVFYTWFAAILEYDNYASNMKIDFPVIYLVYFVVGLVFIFLTSIVSKKNSTIAISVATLGLLLPIGGIINECLPYWYTTLSVLLVTVILAALPLLSLRKSK